MAMGWMGLLGEFLEKKDGGGPPHRFFVTVRPMTKTLIAGLALATWTLTGAASAQSVELLPEASGHLEAARYAPAETDLMWSAWIGAGAGLVRVGGTTLHFNADVETIIGNTFRAFDANQANYHLDLDLRGQIKGHPVSLFLHHVSRHYADRPKTRGVDWNVLGVEVSTGLPGLPARLTGSIGHTTEAALVGYRFEFTERLDVDLFKRSWGQLYLLQKARYVTIEPDPDLDRGSFLDFSIEGGPRFQRAARTLSLFAAYEHRNDVFLEAVGVRDRALFGFRIGL